VPVQVFATDLKMTADGATVAVTIESDVGTFQFNLLVDIKDGDGRQALREASTGLAAFGKELLNAAGLGTIELKLPSKTK
jgi:hypothetical protein